MRRILRVFVILFVAGAVLFATTGVALAAVVVHSGVITISVNEHSADGVNLFIPVPAALVEVGVSSLPLWMPEDELAEVRAQLAPYKDGLRSLGRELAEMPDATLVQVDSDTEHIRIEKVGRLFKISVDAEDADVRVSVPAGSFSRVIHTLT